MLEVCRNVHIGNGENRDTKDLYDTRDPKHPEDKNIGRRNYARVAGDSKERNH